MHGFETEKLNDYFGKYTEKDKCVSLLMSMHAWYVKFDFILNGRLRRTYTVQVK